MDIFFEQIVKKRKSPAEILAFAGILVAGWLLCMALLWLGLLFSAYFMLLLLAAGVVAYFTFKLAVRLNLEYEYSVTNGTLDVDKIINRSDRKRMISLDLTTLDSFEPVDPAKPVDASRYDQIIRAVADPSAQDAVYAAGLRHPSRGRVLVLFQPNEKILNAVRQALPRNLQPRRFG